MGIKIPEICWMLSNLISVLIYMNSWYMQFSGCHVPVATAYFILDDRTSLYSSLFPCYPIPHDSQVILCGCYTVSIYHSLHLTKSMCSTATHWRITFWMSYHLDPILKILQQKPQRKTGQIISASAGIWSFVSERRGEMRNTSEKALEEQKVGQKLEATRWATMYRWR